VEAPELGVGEGEGAGGIMSFGIEKPVMASVQNGVEST